MLHGVDFSSTNTTPSRCSTPAAHGTQKVGTYYWSSDAVILKTKTIGFTKLAQEKNLVSFRIGHIESLRCVHGIIALHFVETACVCICFCIYLHLLPTQPFSLAISLSTLRLHRYHLLLSKSPRRLNSHLTLRHNITVTRRARGHEAMVHHLMVMILRCCYVKCCCELKASLSSQMLPLSNSPEDERREVMTRGLKAKSRYGDRGIEP